MADRKPTLTRRILSVPAEIVIALFLLLDSIVTPLFRPLARWLSSLGIVMRIERAVAALPPYVILVLLVVPFGFAELAKVYAVIMMGEGHFHSGLTIFILAYVVSILICERIFQAGRERLMTIGWFKNVFNWVMMLKDHVLGWLRETKAWEVGVGVKERVRWTYRVIRVRLRSTFGMRTRTLKDKGVLERR